MKINNIVILLLCIGMIYLLFFKEEKMTADANTKKLIQDHYKIDVDAIRNLSKLANDLTKDGKLHVPGGLEVDGNITIKGESKFYKRTWFRNQQKPNVWSHLNEPNGNIVLRGNVNIDGLGGTGKDLNVNGTSTFNGSTNFKNQKTGQMSHLNHPNGNIYLRGNVNIDGHGNSGKDLHVHGNTNVHGNSYLAIRDGQAKVHIDAPNKNGRIITHGANKRQNVLIERAHQGGRILVKNDVTDRWVTGMESHNFGGHMIVNHRDGHHRIHLNGYGDRSEINFSPHKTALLQAHNARFAVRANHQAYFNSNHYRVRYLHHNCPLGAGGEGHTRNTRC
jgi:hypothetical protein